ncbi:hypothetical protein BC826DRAFT_1036218, partial [Russula brevipes]
MALLSHPHAVSHSIPFTTSLLLSLCVPWPIFSSLLLGHSSIQPTSRHAQDRQLESKINQDQVSLVARILQAPVVASGY